MTGYLIALFLYLAGMVYSAAFFAVMIRETRQKPNLLAFFVTMIFWPVIALFILSQDFRKAAK